MNQKKVGSFLKELRKEKGITQEQFAEKLNVSGRSVSRWETGNNMPDISLLVEIADFYDVDVREIIEGERKSEMMDKEVREVAEKMADYANNEKGRLFKTVRLIGIIGVIILAIAIVFQCVKYQPSLLSFIAVALSFAAFVAMMILTLYVNGVLQRLKKNKAVTIGLIIFLFIALAVCLRYIFMVVVLIAIMLVETLTPTKKGSEDYDKAKMVSEFSSEMNSEFMIFPEDLNNAVNSEYAYSTKTGLFDTDGYFILKAEYNEEDYNAEVKRLSDINCDITFQNDSYTGYVLYDENMYNYPAYITSDGYDSVYEYALLDEDNNTIIYVNLSYPKFVDLKDYEDYLKKDRDEYDDNKNTLEKFTIYYHRFPGFDAWVGN
ncbi:MAG: helix-turn-helix domain-containing protein [Lachnospiraceae bacterium]|nr:helix-turn-helix domain-containing protein [Lachnospiraceae bacterium]